MSVLRLQGVLATGLVLLVLGPGALATTIVPVTVEKMAAVSTDIVEARAIDSRARWNPERTLIYTYTRFEVRRTLKGTAPNTITVKQMGGSADGYTQRVSGVEYWQPGEEAVLFLRPSADRDGTLSVTGLVQGSFRMKRQASGEVMVTNGVPDVSAFEKDTGRSGEYRGSRMTLQQLEDRVRKAVEQ